MAGLVYKFVELSIVTEQTLEDAVNAGVAEGWRWDGVRFVVTEHSRRPSMAFVSFVRDSDDTVVRGRAPVITPVVAAAEPPPFTAHRRAPAPPPIELGELDLGEAEPRTFEIDAPITAPASRSRSTPAPRRAAAGRAVDRDPPAPARSGRRRPARR
jgi:hypothetical protein